MQLSAIRSELGRWNETQIKQITKKANSACGTWITVAKWTTQRTEPDLKWEFETENDTTWDTQWMWNENSHDWSTRSSSKLITTRFRFFLVLSERNKLREIGKFLVGYLLQKKRGAGWCWSLVSWVKTHGPESIEKEHEISQKHKTITARDKSSRTERANDILLLNAYGTDGKSGSWK